MHIFRCSLGGSINSFVTFYLIDYLTDGLWKYLWDIKITLLQFCLMDGFFSIWLRGEASRDEHEYLNIWIFEYFGAWINICIRFHDKVHIRIYSNICSVFWIYSNNTECFEQTGCMSYGPKILRAHSPPLVYHESLVK